ncbi:hypothetical protein I7X12_17460 [Halosimplex litoreum]|uniref:Uncharacterized protein n=1 Tax=Halosimplex litoreum TaxID=1198301 RepID=A0A7T3FXF1_9EURY|nr:hypothetical protein [Halosimplex litoreum]QPV62496.1 hypothetical protein I7X12_17460 [Halosimplex litoreum]
MRRRTVLASLGASAALAGCRTVGSPERTDSETETQPTCESPEPRRVELAGSATASDEAQFSATVTIERGRSTAEAPARVTVGLGNDGPDREIDVIDDGRCHILNRGAGRSEPNGLWLYRVGDAPTDRAGECWTRDRPPRDSVGFDGYGCGRYPFESDDTVATTYEVWDDYTVDGYLRPGTYRFDASVALWDEAAEEEGTDSGPTVVDWWFELSVSADGE